jgi:hypothetical protein
MKKWIQEAAVGLAIIMVAAYGVAQTWTKTGAPIQVVTGFGMSADGKIIMAVGSTPPAISMDSGATWTTNSAFTTGGAVASSADGTKLIAALHPSGNGPGPYTIFLSTNSGTTWTQTGLPAGNWIGCVSSADGVKLATAIFGGFIYTSTNSGTTWRTNSTTGINCVSLAASADGTKLAAASAFNDTIYTSTNSGLTWSPTTAPNGGWFSVASSADGSRLIATDSGYTFISTNSGVSWNQTSQTNIAGRTVASSADGSVLIIVVGTSIYTSTNFGINWAETNFLGTNFQTTQWLSAGSSADGSELVAGHSGGVWIYHTKPSPKLNTTASSNKLALSWTVPSTNFVLQSSADLSGWTDLTNQPVLNLTNLQNQVALPSPGSNVYYRLKTP